MAEQAYYTANNIVIPQKEDKKVYVPTEHKQSESSLESGKGFAESIATINQYLMTTEVKMEDNEIIALLVTHYEKALQTISSFGLDKVRILNMLKLLSCDRGVCHCSRRVFGVQVYNRSWIRDNLTGPTLFWWPAPIYCETAQEMIDAIAFRFDKLNELK